MWLRCRVRHIFKAYSAEMAALLLIHSHRHRREDLGGGDGSGDGVRSKNNVSSKEQQYNECL